MLFKVSCKECTHRKVGCHATCPEYEEYRLMCEKRRKERLKSYKYERYFSDKILEAKKVACKLKKFKTR